MRILITGGSGFLGRGIIKYWPENEYVVYSRDEYKQDMAKRIGTNAKWILGDVRDLDRLTYAMQGCDLVIHTAAIKYIPEAEFNVDECIKVNVDGSRNVVTAAIRNGVNRVVGISTDKSVLPVNTYGMTKALMERLFSEANDYSSQTIFTLTRYGNVVGSTGSVFTIFQKQLDQTGELTLTNPEMTRFWQSLSDSVQLIKWAAQAPAGTITIPRGASMSMGRLANYLITSRGLNPDNRIKVIGTRPGEKMHESLTGLHENPRIDATQLGRYELHRIGTKLKCPSVEKDWQLTSDRPDKLVSFFDLDKMIEEANSVSY